ncbi:MAG: transglycosylase domain-containing protein, partial [Eubacteriales bacterium]|nr:transglycosylase domain-containing protein [Eubacteriales bacterium]
MNEKDHSSKIKKITNALKKMRAAIKKTLNKAGGFIKRPARYVLRVFKKKGRNEFITENENTKVSGDTQIFDALDISEAEGPVYRRKKADMNTRTRELPHISKEHLSGEGKEHANMFKTKRRNYSFFVGVVLTSIKLLLIAVFMIGAAGLGTLVGIAKAYMETTPTLNTAEIEEQSETSNIYDCNGEWIAAYTGSENRDWASIDEIPEMLQKAVIAIEDVRFDYHSGVDIKRIVGVFIDNLMNDNIQGGSTITQQLIKNSVLSTERTYKRKIQEAYLAIQLEQEYEKSEILESYLNTINLGASNYGVKAAAMDYFGKDLDNLTLRECAMLAGITQYPYLYNPRRCYYIVEDPDIINDRTDDVLYQMYIAGFITEEEYQQALNDDVTVLEESEVKEMYDYPYFIEYAIYDIITHLLDERNLQDTDENRNAIDDELRTGGFSIYLTIDTEIQQIVQDSLEEWDDYPALADTNDSVAIYENSDGTVDEVIQPQAAAVVLEQSTGELKAIVGGRETPTARKTLNRAYQTSMPVGSSIKPIAVYAPAIDLGYSDGTVVPNLPVAIEGWDTESGYPSGGSLYYGPVTLRTALVKSLNSATAYTLMNLVGLDESYNYLISMGINPSHISKTGSGLALGTSGITPIELAAAYATIANSGTYLEALSFTKVVDSHGDVILNADEIREERDVFDESTAWLVTDMLVNAVESG